MANDPVCKMNVDADMASKSTEYAGKQYYFCSNTCYKLFMAEPEKYTNGDAAANHSCCEGH
jgi:Cu+-exporting ATPase|tara:strand:+ start:333 stop:515 length:183 start_codon:yes stop_codon:yes gene_type:complete